MCCVSTEHIDLQLIQNYNIFNEPISLGNGGITIGIAS
jgi:hypothetical protein